MRFDKCLIISSCVVILFCTAGNSLDLNKINGTWIVRNTSDSVEAGACPFVKINVTGKETVMTYESNMTDTFDLMINASSSNIHTLKDSLNNTGNLTIYGGNLPFYIVVGVKVTKETPTFLVLTGHITVPSDQLKNISKLLNSTKDLQKVHFYPVATESKACKNYLVQHFEKADGGYPDVKNEVIPWSGVTTPTSVPTTTKKPNSASGLNVSSFVFIISMLFLCWQ